MKILFTGVRPDERPALDQWCTDHPEHEVTATDRVLGMDLIPMVQGHQALTVQQVITPEPEIYEALAEAGIRQISSRSAGVDMYDLKAAAAAGIAVTNVPVYSPNAIAEFVLASVLHMTRRFPEIERRTAARDFRFAGLIGRELATMKVAILGTGSIGLRTARLFKALGSEIVGYDPYPRPEFEEIGTYAGTVEDALRDADVVSLHMPATEQTHHLIDAKALALLAPGAILANAARGAVLDTQALIDALDSGHLSGAVLDTYDNEAQYFRYDWRDRDLGDPVLEQLLERDDVLVTPHVAFYTETAVANLVTGGLDNAVEVVETGTCASVVRG